MIIYIVRHAEPISRREMSDGEALSVALSSFGKIQSEALARGFKKLNIKKIFTSPIKRAAETAEIVSKNLGVPATYLENLREFSVDTKGKDLEVLKELKRNAFADKDFVPPEGESLNSAATRLAESLGEISKKEIGSVCVVSHQMIIESFFSVFLKGFENFGWMQQGRVNAIEVNEKGEFQLIFANKRLLDLKLIAALFKRKLGLV